MGGNSKFMTEKVDILRPALEVDVTVIRDRILTEYALIQSRARCYREAEGGDLVFDSNLGSVAVDRWSFYFPRGTTVRQDDVLKLTDRVTGDISYFSVRSREDYSNHRFHVRCRTILKNYHRGQA